MKILQIPLYDQQWGWRRIFENFENFRFYANFFILRNASYGFYISFLWSPRWFRVFFQTDFVGLASDLSSGARELIEKPKISARVLEKGDRVGFSTFRPIFGHQNSGLRQNSQNLSVRTLETT